MDANHLQTIIVNSINQAVSSGQTTVSQVILILEYIKLDVHANDRDLKKSQSIIPIRGKLPPQQNGGGN